MYSSISPAYAPFKKWDTSFLICISNPLFAVKSVIGVHSPSIMGKEERQTGVWVANRAYEPRNAGSQVAAPFQCRMHWLPGYQHGILDAGWCRNKFRENQGVSVKIPLHHARRPRSFRPTQYFSRPETRCVVCLPSKTKVIFRATQIPVKCSNLLVVNPPL